MPSVGCNGCAQVPSRPAGGGRKRGAPFVAIAGANSGVSKSVLPVAVYAAIPARAVTSQEYDLHRGSRTADHVQSSPGGH